jgi:hypothetical protein
LRRATGGRGFDGVGEGVGADADGLTDGVADELTGPGAPAGEIVSMGAASVCADSHGSACGVAKGARARAPGSQKAGS